MSDDEDRKKRCREEHHAPGYRTVGEPFDVPGLACFHEVRRVEGDSDAAPTKAGGGGNSRAFVDGWEATFGKGVGGMVN